MEIARPCPWGACRCDLSRLVRSCEATVRWRKVLREHGKLEEHMENMEKHMGKHMGKWKNMENMGKYGKYRKTHGKKHGNNLDT